MRSVSKLSSTYHRIIFAVSLSDIITSFAVAVSTMPMPSNTREVYPFFKGKMIGNTQTCAVQAFAYIFGFNLTFNASLALSLFYLCKIRYNMRDEILRRYVEPFFLVSGLTFSFAGPIMLYQKQLYNPVPFVSWCNFGDYPYGCFLDDDIECIRGGDSSGFYQARGVFIGSIIGVSIHVVSMFLIVLSVYQADREWQIKTKDNSVSRDASTAPNQTEEEDSNSTATRESADQNVQFSNTKIIAKQALMYVAAFCATNVFIPNITSNTGSTTLQIMTLILKPSQGFFNAIIFVNHKVYTLQQCHSDLSFSEALRIVITSTSSVPEMIITFDSAASRTMGEERGIVRPQWFYSMNGAPENQENRDIHRRGRAGVKPSNPSNTPISIEVQDNLSTVSACADIESRNESWIDDNVLSLDPTNASIAHTRNSGISFGLSVFSAGSPSRRGTP